MRNLSVGLALMALAWGCSSSGSGGGLDGGAGQSGGGGLGGGGGSGGVLGGGAGVAGVAGSSGGASGASGAGGHTVSGKVEIVNPGPGTATSVILADASIFDPDVPSTTPPPGPKAMNVVGDWTITNVPNGSYWVLVAWENDFLTLDPDTSIAGTTMISIDVSGSDVDLTATSFKVTGALDVSSPDGGQTASAPLAFEWSDDSGEASYELRLFDSLGTLVYEQVGIPPVSGSATVTVPYEGPALSSGMTYQFGAVAVSSAGTPIARTEDLRGVFIAP
jgi:hypothetical protein